MNLELRMQSVPIIINFVKTNPVQARCTRFNIIWESLSVTCGRSMVFSTDKADRHDINEILLIVALNTTILIHINYKCILLLVDCPDPNCILAELNLPIAVIALSVTFHSFVVSPRHNHKTTKRWGDIHFNLVLSLWRSLVLSSHHNDKTTERN